MSTDRDHPCCKHCRGVPHVGRFGDGHRTSCGAAECRGAVESAPTPDLTIGGDDYLAIVERQRAEALATIERVKALAQKWTEDFMTRDATHDDRDDRADARDDCAMDIRTALERPAALTEVRVQADAEMEAPE